MCVRVKVRVPVSLRTIDSSWVLLSPIGRQLPSDSAKLDQSVRSVGIVVHARGAPLLKIVERAVLSDISIRADRVYYSKFYILS